MSAAAALPAKGDLTNAFDNVAGVFDYIAAKIVPLALTFAGGFAMCSLVHWMFDYTILGPTVNAVGAKIAGFIGLEQVAPHVHSTVTTTAASTGPAAVGHFCPADAMVPSGGEALSDAGRAFLDGIIPTNG